ncbi:hypothetical protein [Aquimarina brevivitae]|uniref:GLPGLI family protein n=1 Tax=Aquimarina brevivitae TaxID=323412 RepID=A0A4V2F5T7_9FLAO|nr:hypothetical protein [Aquimarina brevivitae]RZS93959.1 GLPGLI family protein [Aquimarina brevivitae]
MKTSFSILLTVFLAMFTFAQDGVYIKYELKIENTTPEAEMMAAMMQGSMMEVASGASSSYVNTKMGSMMTTVAKYDLKKNHILIYMEGMMGKMAFEGNPNKEEENSIQNLTFHDETKMILSKKCKKATSTDEEGNTSVFWYTEEIPRPEGIDIMPNQLPGICLEISTQTAGEMTMTFTASSLKENIDLSDYNVNVPKDVEIKSLEEMTNMGMGTN